jgi:hypothetical protein
VKIILPDVLLAAQIHFNCGTLDGVPLENENAFTDQFYWERRFFFDDVNFSQFTEIGLTFLDHDSRVQYQPKNHLHHRCVSKSNWLVSI